MRTSRATEVVEPTIMAWYGMVRTGRSVHLSPTFFFKLHKDVHIAFFRKM
jgi:hypothetical protein